MVTYGLRERNAGLEIHTLGEDMVPGTQEPQRVWPEGADTGIAESRGQFFTIPLDTHHRPRSVGDTWLCSKLR
jgi:hypothetical protein